MDDPSAIQIGAGAFGVVSVSALLMVLLSRVKDYFPSIHGRRAMLACDVLAFMVSLLVVGQTSPNWRQGVTWLAVGMGTLSLGIVARGLYASQHHVAVEGSPPSAEASVPAAAVNDPQQPDDAQPMSDAEVRDALRAGRFQ